MTEPVTEGEKKPWNILEETNGTIYQRVMLFYGQSGSGKTRLACEIFGSDTLLLSCDPGGLGGALSAIHLKPKHIKVDSHSQLVALIPLLKKDAGKEFKCLVVDSVSYLQRIFMSSILQTIGRELPRFEEWNLCVERMRNIIKQIAELDCHVIFTATEDTQKDEITGAIFGGPNLPGKLAKELPQACDIVAHLMATSAYNSQGKREVVYKMINVPDGVWFARDRTSKLPAECIVGKNPVDSTISIGNIFKPLF